MYTIVFFLWWFYEIYHMITLDSYKYLIRGISNKYSEKKVKSEWDSISITVSIIYSIRSSQVLNQCIDRSQMLQSKPMSKHPYGAICPLPLPQYLNVLLVSQLLFLPLTELLLLLPQVTYMFISLCLLCNFFLTLNDHFSFLKVSRTLSKYSLLIQNQRIVVS